MNKQQVCTDKLPGSPDAVSATKAVDQFSLVAALTACGRASQWQAALLLLSETLGLQIQLRSTWCFCCCESLPSILVSND